MEKMLSRKQSVVIYLLWIDILKRSKASVSIPAPCRKGKKSRYERETYATNDQLVVVSLVKVFFVLLVLGCISEWDHEEPENWRCWRLKWSQDHGGYFGTSSRKPCKLGPSSNILSLGNGRNWIMGLNGFEWLRDSFHKHQDSYNIVVKARSSVLARGCKSVKLPLPDSVYLCG